MVAATPPMGWNSWHAFRCEIDEQLIRTTADAMVENGMKDAGYEYVVIDDCWQASRDEEGNIVPDAEKFPSGMAALVDYVHGKGLKFGLYSNRARSLDGEGSRSLRGAFCCPGGAARRGDGADPALAAPAVRRNCKMDLSQRPESEDRRLPPTEDEFSATDQTPLTR